jgi:2-polyprenyl-3-methyl-5-hydroxy-6-metoxy-1,4-benzoquinol methylase
MTGQFFSYPRSPAMLVDQTSEEFQQLLSRYWYYSLEHAPGRFTNADLHPNIVVWRDLLQRVALKGAQCIDVGCMEGMAATLLARRDTKNVLAIDALDFSDKVSVVKAIYGVKFKYHPRISLPETLNFLRERQRLEAFGQSAMEPRGFDVAIMTGLLYHAFSPLHIIGLARSLLRPGGIVVFETAASTRDEFAMHWNFNGNGWIYPNGTNTWFITLRLLDHFMRFLRLKPVDVCHVQGSGDIVRVGVTAVAVDEPLGLEREGGCFHETTSNFGYHDLVDLHFAQSRPGQGRPPISVDARPGLFFHEGTNLVDIHRSVTERPALAPDPDRIRFRLVDRF